MSSGPIFYVEKDYNGVIVDDVTLGSESIVIPKYKKSNSQTSGALADAAGAMKLTGAAVVSGTQFGSLTADAAGDGVTGAENACFFTFTQPGVYSVNLDSISFSQAGVWAFGDLAYIRLTSSTTGLNIRMSVLDLPALSTGLSCVVNVPDNEIIYFDFVAVSAGNGTLTQGNTGSLSILKLGDI